MLLVRLHMVLLLCSTALWAEAEERVLEGVFMAVDQSGSLAGETGADISPDQQLLTYTFERVSQELTHWEGLTYVFFNIRPSAHRVWQFDEPSSLPVGFPHSPTMLEPVLEEFSTFTKTRRCPSLIVVLQGRPMDLRESREYGQAMAHMLARQDISVTVLSMNYAETDELVQSFHHGRYQVLRFSDHNLIEAIKQSTLRRYDCVDPVG